MTIIGSFVDGQGVTQQVNLITWCKATYGKIVYDLEIVGTGIRFQVDCEQSDTLQQKLQKAKAAYIAAKQATADVAISEPLVAVYVPASKAEAAQRWVDANLL